MLGTMYADDAGAGEPVRAAPDAGADHGPDPATWLDDHGDALFAFALQRVRDRSVAEDLVQDTLLAAIGARGQFRGGSSERTWLTAILKHKVLDWYRVRDREQPLGERAGEVPDMNADFFDDTGHWQRAPGTWDQPEAALEQAQFWQQFNGCLEKLPERLRLIYVFREIDGLETEEIIRALDISSRNNVWTMLSRSRMQLRECLEKNWFGR